MRKVCFHSGRYLLWGENTRGDFDKYYSDVEGMEGYWPCAGRRAVYSSIKGWKACSCIILCDLVLKFIQWLSIWRIYNFKDFQPLVVEVTVLSCALKTPETPCIYSLMRCKKILFQILLNSRTRGLYKFYHVEWLPHLLTLSVIIFH